MTPEPELARLTLVSSERAEIIRRQSLLSPSRPSLGEIQGKPILGPLGPPQTNSVENSEMLDNTNPSAATVDSVEGKPDRGLDSASDVTLVDAPVESMTDSMAIDLEDRSNQQKVLDNKENLPPTKEAANENSPEVDLIPLGETSSSRINEQHGLRTLAKCSTDDDTIAKINASEGAAGGAGDFLGNEDAATKAAPPRRSPPLPPRPRHVDTGASNALQEAEYGAQQDVTEVIANCLFQLQCAIKAESQDETGEQIDCVKRLFFGKQKSYTTDKHGKTRTKEEYMSDIKVDVATGPRDIYAALDGAYDVQEVEVGGGIEPQYTSISQAPPILQVHVQRSLYDRERKAAFKSINHLELKEMIYLDRYMDSDNPDLIERRQQCWQWKQQSLILKRRRAQLVQFDVSVMRFFRSHSH